MIRTAVVRRALLAGAAALITVVFAAGCGDTSGMNQDGMTAGGPGASPGSSVSGEGFNEADIGFVQMMIPHHEQAAEMATLAQTRAADPEIKQIAAQVKAAQEPEITTMTGWLETWGMPTAGGHNMPGMEGTDGMPGMASEEEMTQLMAANGVDFDRMFARMMIAHHNGAIQMCRDVMDQGQSAEARALAATIEQAQAAEVAAMETILDRL